MGSESIRYRVGVNVSRLRKQQGKSLEDVAKYMQLIGFKWSVSRVSELERGNKPVSINELLGLAFILGDEDDSVTIQDFFVGKAHLDLSEVMNITTEGMIEVFSGGSARQPTSEYPKWGLRVKEITTEAFRGIADRAKEMDKYRTSKTTIRDLEDLESAQNLFTGPAEVKAAKTLGVTKLELVGACLELWGNSLTIERDKRAEGLQGRAKGHVTRQLLSELREYMGKSNGSD